MAAVSSPVLDWDLVPTPTSFQSPAERAMHNLTFWNQVDCRLMAPEINKYTDICNCMTMIKKHECMMENMK